MTPEEIRKWGLVSELYKLTFPNGMVYIGVTVDTKKRWANRGAHYRAQPIYKEIRRFGWDNIGKKVLLSLPFSYENSEALKDMELELIHAYGDKAYNCQGNDVYHKKIGEKIRATNAAKMA